MQSMFCIATATTLLAPRLLPPAPRARPACACVPSLPPAPRARPARACVPSLEDDDGSCALDEYCIYFVTGNPKKEREVNAILGQEDMRPFNVQHVDIDLEELQGDPNEIAKAKCRLAAERTGGAVLIEDTSLCFSALNGLPGPCTLPLLARNARRGRVHLCQTADARFLRSPSIASRHRQTSSGLLIGWATRACGRC